MLEHRGSILVCGGGMMYTYTSSCLVLQGDRWIPHSNLTTDKRYNALSVKLEGKTCILGGWENDGSSKNIECLDTEEKWVRSHEQVPGSGLLYSCSVTINSTSIFFFGGIYDKTQVIQRLGPSLWDTESFPRMPVERYNHGCEKISD